MDNNFSKALNYQKELRSIIHEGITVTVNNENFTLTPNTVMSLDWIISFNIEKIGFKADGKPAREFSINEVKEILSEYDRKLSILREEANTLAWSTVHIDKSEEKISLRDVLKEKGLI